MNAKSPAVTETLQSLPVNCIDISRKARISVKDITEVLEVLFAKNRTEIIRQSEFSCNTFHEIKGVIHRNSMRGVFWFSLTLIARPKGGNFQCNVGYCLSC